jgi:hypothetical protein
LFWLLVCVGSSHLCLHLLLLLLRLTRLLRMHPCSIKMLKEVSAAKRSWLQRPSSCTSHHTSRWCSKGLHVRASRLRKQEVVLHRQRLLLQLLQLLRLRPACTS